MPDFPVYSSAQSKTQVINTLSWDTLAGEFFAISGAAGTSAAWTNANTAVYIPFVLSNPMLVQKIGVHVGVQSGNLDVGIYGYDGTRLVHQGSTAVGAAGLQSIDITDTWLSSGTYFAAMNVDNTTAAFFSSNLNVIGGRLSGLLIQAVGAVTLPSSATFAVYSARRVPNMILTGVSTL
jgi:hypothetical protein